MIRFYPRDIQLWRKTFKWNGISEPSKIFDSVDALKQFCIDHGIRVSDEKYPFHLESCDNYISDKKYAVIQWSCIGWVNDEQD